MQAGPLFSQRSTLEEITGDHIGSYVVHLVYAGQDCFVDSLLRLGMIMDWEKNLEVTFLQPEFTFNVSILLSRSKLLLVKHH